MELVKKNLMVSATERMSGSLLALKFLSVTILILLLPLPPGPRA